MTDMHATATSRPTSTIDAFMCVHRNDVDYLLDVVLRSYRLNFVPQGKLFLITNDRPYLARFVERLGLHGPIIVSGDEEWLSRRELALPGWYRQQLIKLRAYQFCETPNFCNIGADTVLLQRITEADLVTDSLPIQYYRKHPIPTIHFFYEWTRLRNVARILQVKPRRSLRYIDFISDLFCFNRELLMELNRYLEANYGAEPYETLLAGLGSDTKNYNKFGEWTLYSTFLLDVLKLPLTIKNSADGFIHQVHSPRSFNRFRFDSKAVHFVSKEFDVERIKREIVNRGSELGQHLTPRPA